MKRLFLLMMISCFAVVGAFAQEWNRPKMSQEEFRQKQTVFLTERAGLTKEEAAKFFPIYYELQDKKKALNDQAWAKMRKGKHEDLTEAQYESIITSILNNRIASDKLEKAYFLKFKTILSCEKIFKVQGAEMRFHRELLKELGRKP